MPEEILYSISGSTLTNIADAIRGQTGSSETMTPSDMISNINEMMYPKAIKMVLQQGADEYVNELPQDMTDSIMVWEFGEEGSEEASIIFDPGVEIYFLAGPEDEEVGAIVNATMYWYDYTDFTESEEEEPVYDSRNLIPMPGTHSYNLPINEVLWVQGHVYKFFIEIEDGYFNPQKLRTITTNVAEYTVPEEQNEGEPEE